METALIVLVLGAFVFLFYKSHTRKNTQTPTTFNDSGGGGETSDGGSPDGLGEIQRPSNRV